jgi:hypothetical protein
MDTGNVRPPLSHRIDNVRRGYRMLVPCCDRPVAFVASSRREICSILLLLLLDLYISRYYHSYTPVFFETLPTRACGIFNHATS